MADFLHHLAGVFLEMALVAIGELARFHIEETEWTDRLAVRRMQRRAGIETETSLPNPRVVGKAAISREVFNNSDLVLRDNMAAYRNIPRGLPRFGQIIRQASVALEEKTMPINERDQRHRHLEDTGKLAEEMSQAPVPDNEEERLAALAELQLLDTEAEPVFDRIIAKQRRGLGDLVQRFGKRDNHLIRAGIAQTPSRRG